MTVKSILDEKGRDAITLTSDQSVKDAVDLLASKRIGALVVLNSDGGLCGILSERDVVRVLSQKGTGVLDGSVDSLMTKSVVTCTEDQTITRVMELMTEGRFRHLPVVDGDKLVGVISIGDVVRRRIEDAEREAEEVKSYIAMP